MPLRERQITAAVGDAYDFMAALPAHFEPAYGAPAHSRNHSLAEFPDDIILEGYRHARFRISPNEVRLKDAEGLVIAIRALSRVSGRVISEHQVNEVLFHEGMHNIAAEQIGFKVVHYGLSIQGIRDTQIDWAAFGIHEELDADPTKLALAAVAAAPVRISEGDESLLDFFGYIGAEDVAARVLAYNRQTNGPLLPVPLCTEVPIAA